MDCAAGDLVAEGIGHGDRRDGTIDCNPVPLLLASLTRDLAEIEASTRWWNHPAVACTARSSARRKVTGQVAISLRLFPPRCSKRPWGRCCGGLESHAPTRLISLLCQNRCPVVPPT